MDKKYWKESHEKLKKVLKVKQDQVKAIEQDIEEIEFTIGCYQAKIKTL